MKIHVIIVPDDEEESNDILHSETVIDSRAMQNRNITDALKVADKVRVFNSIKNTCGRIVIPVGDPWREYEYSIDWNGRLHEGVTSDWRTTGRWFRVRARNAEEADMRAKMAVSEKRAAEFERRKNGRAK